MPGIDHLMINANQYEASVKFYSWLMPKIGYPEKHTYGGEDPVTGFSGPGGSFWLSNSATNLRSDNFHKRRVGLREIAFRADSRGAGRRGRERGRSQRRQNPRCAAGISAIRAGILFGVFHRPRRPEAGSGELFE